MTTLVQEANRPEDHVPPNMGIMAVLDSSGDTRHTWDRTKPEEVATIRGIFDDMKTKGYQAFSVKRNGEKGTRITDFDETAEKIIFAPALVGG